MIFEKKPTLRSGIEAELRSQSVTSRQMDVDQYPDIFEFKVDNDTGELLVRFKDFVTFYGSDPFP